MGAKKKVSKKVVKKVAKVAKPVQPAKAVKEASEQVGANPTKKVVKKTVKKMVKKAVAKSAEATNKPEVKSATKKSATVVAKKPIKKAAVATTKAKSVAKKASKKGTPSKTASSKAAEYSFQQDYLVLMQRDPNWLHAFWNVSERRSKMALKEGRKMVLRLYDVSRDLTVQNNRIPVQEIEIPQEAHSWYIERGESPESNTSVVEIGTVGTDGSDYEPMVASNPTENNEEFFELYRQWQQEMDLFVRESLGSEEIWEFWSSGEAMRRFAKDKKAPLPPFPMGLNWSSGAVSSGEFMGRSGMGIVPPEGAKRAKDFFFWVKTRLIVYGGTKPDAQLKVRGEPHPLNADGTFYLEMDLPDSSQVIPCRAIGAQNENGDQDITIVPIVVKRTE